MRIWSDEGGNLIDGKGRADLAGINMPKMKNKAVRNKTAGNKTAGNGTAGDKTEEIK